MRWFGTVRARTGVIVDNVLIYADRRLGLRSASIATLTVFEDAPATSATFSSSPHALGLDRRVGTEWSFAANWSLKSEFLYMRFQKMIDLSQARPLTASISACPAAATSSTNRKTSWVTRIGLNYRF